MQKNTYKNWAIPKEYTVKNIFLILFLLLLSNSLFALPNFNCDIKSNGEVLMSYIYSPEINQKLEVFVGYETWSRPFEIMELCEKLTHELIDNPTAYWDEYHCTDFGVMASKKFISFPLTEAGKKLVGPNRTKMLFIPAPPVLPEFLIKIEDPECDDY